MRGALVVFALLASVASLFADNRAGAHPIVGTWTVRTTYTVLSTRVGNPPAVLEYTVEEHQETGITSPRVALDRARTIAREGFQLDVDGRAVIVPPSRVELVEVLDVP